MKHLKRFNESDSYYKDLVIDIFQEVIDEYLVEETSADEADYIDVNGLYYYYYDIGEDLGDFDFRIVLFYNFGYSETEIGSADIFEKLKSDVRKNIIPRLESIGYKLSTSTFSDDMWSSFVISINYPNQNR